MAYRDSFPEVVPLDSYADLLPTVTPTYALFFPKFPGWDSSLEQSNGAGLELCYFGAQFVGFMGG